MKAAWENTVLAESEQTVVKDYIAFWRGVKVTD
jgi:hypothetical protein